MNKKLVIKCCGIAQYDQLVHLQKMDVDLIGHIYYDRSPRKLDSFQLMRFLKADGDKAQVLVTVDYELDHLCALVDRYSIPYVQLHGSESPEYCRQLRSRTQVIKAQSVRKASDFNRVQLYEGVIDFFLFDTKTPDLIGGTGLQWNWSLLNHYTGSTPFFISGGIKPTDVDRILALEYEHLYGVDINSRFEIKPGVKDLNEIQYFVDKVKNKNGE